MPNNSTIKAVVFDLDGLMFNTEEVFNRTGNELLRRRGHQMTDSLLSGMMGRRANAVQRHTVQDPRSVLIDSAHVTQHASDPGIVQRQTLEEIYAAADDVDIVVKRVESLEGGGPAIIKKCSEEEQAWYETFSGKRHFPKFIKKEDLYVALEFIGSYPKPAPDLGDGLSTDAELAQLATICVTLAKEDAVHHQDMRANILNNGGEFVTIDFDANSMKKQGSFEVALTLNAGIVKKFIAKDSQSRFDELIANEAP